MTDLRNPIAAGFAGLSLFALAGCPGKGGSGPPIQSAAEISPDALYDKAANLNYGGTTIAVTMERIAKGSTIEFALSAHGQVLETETYRLEPAFFALVSIDEVFEPPLTLLKFPMQVGDKWTWEGRLKMGSLDHPAKARVETREEKLVVGRRDPFTLRVDAELEIESGASSPAKRQLTFWFERGHGIVKREIGTATVREPKD